MSTPAKDRLDVVYSLLRGDMATVLGDYSITLRHGLKGWMNLSTCPWCGHGPENFQCGILETPGEKGFIHGVRCKHPHDSPTGAASPHYADFLVALGALTQEEADTIKGGPKVANTIRNISTVIEHKTTRKALSKAPSPTGDGTLGRMNEENNAKGRKRLRENVTAMEYLLKVRGYTAKTIERFKLGLSEPYIKDGTTVHSGALMAPLIGRDGKFYKKYVNYSLPGVTVDNRENAQRAWSPGATRAYYAGDCLGKKWLFVCDGLKDIWALSQLLEGSALESELALASATNGGQGFPDEWRNEEFWGHWEHVFAGHDNDTPAPLTGLRAGDELALALAVGATREVRRVSPPGVRDWNDWVLEGNKVEDFQLLLETAEPIKTVEAIEDRDDGRMLGRFAANPVSIVGAFHNGYLYEAVRTMVRTIDEETGEFVERFDTLVIRSDRTTHRVRTMSAPKGTPEHNLVRRLTPDNTMISSYPEPNPNLTWSWDAIQAWLAGNDRTPSLKFITEKIENHLRGSVWLPYSDDYAILTCAIVASFVQQVFDAVPLLLVTGSAGTGKSELGLAMKSMGANSKNVLGVVTAATLARFIDSTRGLVVIDDLEEISGTKDSTFGDLVQTLKLSYKKATAQKMVTEMKNGKPTQRQFNFFGIKVISNTRGADAILGTRMLTINTRLMPRGMHIQRDLAMSPEDMAQLRNHLHCWAFSNVGAVNDSYQRIFPNKTVRQDEISAPLRVVVDLAQNPSLKASLDKALERQSRVQKDPESPDAVLKEALTNIIRRSIERDGNVQTWVSVSQAMMEMRTLVDANYGKEFTTSLAAIDKPEWIGRTLRRDFTDDDGANSKRTTLNGKSLRAYELSANFIAVTVEQMAKETPDLVAQDLPSSEDFKSFCSDCSQCPYRARCAMREERLRTNAQRRQ